MCLQIVTTSLHYFWNQLFVENMNLGIIGTCYASTVTMLTNLIMITLISSFVDKIKDAWFFPNKDCLVGILDYIKIGVPSMLVGCLESWSFNIQTLMATYVSVDALAA